MTPVIGALDGLIRYLMRVNISVIIVLKHVISLGIDCVSEGVKDSGCRFLHSYTCANCLGAYDESTVCTNYQ